jgi:hypothetical protein
MNKVTITSKLGHYQAELTDTLEGVEIKVWFCYQDTSGMRRWVSTDVVDAPFHYVAHMVHESIWGMVPEIITQRSN